MQDIIANVLTTLIIILVVEKIRKTAIKSEKGLNERKGKKVFSKGNFYIVQYSKQLRIIIVMGTLMFLIAFLVNVLTYFKICILGTNVSLFSTIGIGLLTVLCIVGCGGIVIWRITVDGNEILYRNYFGITKRYTFNDISEIKETKSYRLIAYSHGKRIFTIDDNVPGWESFRYTAGIKGVPIIHEQQKKKV